MCAWTWLKNTSVLLAVASIAFVLEILAKLKGQKNGAWAVNTFLLGLKRPAIIL